MHHYSIGADMSDILLAAEIDAFNRLFCQLSNQEDHICWMRSIDFKRQLYLSPQFEQIFGRSISTLYDTPESWYDFLLKLDNKDMRIIMPKRIKNPQSHNGENVVYYRIATTNGDIRYIRDWSILLRDKNQQCIAVAGVAERISAQTWFEEQENQNLNHFETTLAGGKTLQEILEQEKQLHILPQQPKSSSLSTPLHTLNIDGIQVELSKREAACLQQLCLGRSAKETAEILHISSRTVESHIDNIKQKSFCKSKVQLLSYVIQQFIPS